MTSLPRSGTVRAARLLAEIGDARGRFPTAAVRQDPQRRLPVRRRQGTPRRPLRLRRRLPPREPLGRPALPTSPRPRGDHPHAVRIPARAWAHIIWRCRQDHTPDDPARHQALPGNPQPRSTGGLTQGNSSRGLLTPAPSPTERGESATDCHASPQHRPGQRLQQSFRWAAASRYSDACSPDTPREATQSSTPGALQPALHQFRGAAVQVVGPPFDVGEDVGDAGQVLQFVAAAVRGLSSSGTASGVSVRACWLFAVAATLCARAWWVLRSAR